MGGAPRKRLNALGVRQRQPWRTQKDSARVTSAPERVQGENVPRPCLPERYIHVGTRTASRHPSHPCRGFPTVKQHKTESNTGYKKKQMGRQPSGSNKSSDTVRAARVSVLSLPPRPPLQRPTQRQPARPPAAHTPHGAQPPPTTTQRAAAKHTVHNTTWMRPATRRDRNRAGRDGTRWGTVV